MARASERDFALSATDHLGQSSDGNVSHDAHSFRLLMALPPHRARSRQTTRALAQCLILAYTPEIRIAPPALSANLVCSLPFKLTVVFSVVMRRHNQISHGLQGFQARISIHTQYQACNAAYSRTVGMCRGKLSPFGRTASQPRQASQIERGIAFSPSR